MCQLGKKEYEWDANREQIGYKWGADGVRWGAVGVQMGLLITYIVDDYYCCGE